MLSEEKQTADQALRRVVLKTLATEDLTAQLEIRVGVLNGIVHLAGQAPSVELWHLVEQLAAGVPGVRAVVNRIEAPGAPSPARTIHLHLD